MKKKSPKPKLTRKRALALRRIVRQLKRGDSMIDKLPDGIYAKHRAALKGLVGAVKGPRSREILGIAWVTLERARTS